MMLNLPGDANHITIYVLSGANEPPIGATRVPLRQAREIQTETGRLVGWYIEHTAVAIIRTGLLIGFVFVLPNNEPLTIPCEQIGVKRGGVQIGQLILIDQLRLIHPTAQRIVLGA
jgi:hypothetical protein